MTGKTDEVEALKQLTYLASALKAPRITEAATRLADHARDAGWTHEEYLAAILDREVAARNASGAQLRIRAVGFGSRKTLEEFYWNTQSTVRQQTAALASGGFLAEARNVVIFARPAPGRLTWPPACVSPPATTDIVCFSQQRPSGSPDSPTLTGPPPTPRAHPAARYGLIIIDEVGYLPFEQDAANLFLQLVSSRFEHASLILTSNLPSSGWGGVFGDQAVAAAMIDRIVHHADVLTLKGASYRLRNRGIDTLPGIRTQGTADKTTRTDGIDFDRRIGLTFERCRHNICGPQSAVSSTPLAEAGRAGSIVMFLVSSCRRWPGADGPLRQVARPARGFGGGGSPAAAVSQAHPTP